MSSIMEIMQLCRLCLVKDQVNFPIFEEQGDIRQIFLKITACLPVKVAKDDNLPKKICDGCLYKLELLYQFWNTAANAEKQLLTWLSQAGMDADAKTTHDAVAVAQQSQAHSHSVKQEVVEPCENENKNENSEDLSTEAQNYIIQQQQLPYESVGFPYEEENFNETQESNGGGDEAVSEEQEGPLPKRRRRQCAETVVEPEEAEEDDDDISQEMPVTKTEEESDTEEETRVEDGEPTNFVPIGGSGDNEQPGPSGMGKVASEAPSLEPLITLTEFNQSKIRWNQSRPELEIIPVGSDGKPMEQDAKNQVSGVTTRSATKRGRRRRPASGYINPFNYSNLTMKKFHRKNKLLETTSIKMKWACMICNEISIDKESLIEHYEVHKEEKEARVKVENEQDDMEYFNCAICGTEFTSLKSYEKHFDKKHGDRKYTCFECGKVYKDALQLCIHNFTVHPRDDKKYKCIICEFCTSTRKSIMNHLQKHEDSYKYKCEICGKSFEMENWYEEHKNIHGNIAAFSCDVCGKTFPYTRHLLAHKKTTHPELFGKNSAVNECHLCNKRFAHKKSLILHVRGHSGENSVLCDMCGKRLSSSEHLKQHLRIHTGFKPHKCSVCGKGFAKKCNLTLHERVHSGEKPYVCKVCSKAFSQRSTLVIHERYHSGERPYVCTLCNKGFVAKGLLSVHIKNCSVIPAEYL